MIYIVFAGSDHYPSGGAEDLQVVTDNKKEAIRSAIHHYHDKDWSHVFSLAEGRVIWKNGDDLDTGDKLPNPEEVRRIEQGLADDLRNARRHSRKHLATRKD